MKAPIDLRSDTVTRPSAGMREAMANAEVGDDVIDRDPTCERLQEQIAGLLGKEAALFMPSGSMTNQIAVRIHCKPGDEFIGEAGCHIYNYEQAAFAQLSGIAARTVEGHFGVLQPEQLLGLIRPQADHMVRTRLVCLENTHNRGAGRIQPLGHVQKICEWAHANSLRTHLDGARLFNAVVATGIPLATWGQHFDTVSVCFSKGLGAPVGSALVGSAEMIREARRHRKLFGGGMRQAGILAAAAIYALEHNIPRLIEDHQHARQLADAIRECPGLTLCPDTIDSNIVIFSVDPSMGLASEFSAALSAQGVLVLAIGANQIRAVTHLDISKADIEHAASVLRDVASSAGQQVPSRRSAASAAM